MFLYTTFELDLILVAPSACYFDSPFPAFVVMYLVMEIVFEQDILFFCDFHHVIVAK